MSSKVQHVSGMKGSDVFDGTGSSLVDLSALLVRNGWNEQLKTLFLEALEASEDDAFVLAFQTRDIRGGKGERKLFTQMASILLMHRRRLMGGLLDLVPEYGCWRDLYELPGVRDEVIWLMAKQLREDTSAEKKSLCAKWAPREGKDTQMAKDLAGHLFPEETKLSQRLKRYRHLVADLNRKLDTTEIKMCAKQFADIEPAHVPGACLAKHIKALLNEPVKGHGLRHPDDKDRMDCREHFKEHLERAVKGEAKVNGAVTRYPHQVIKDVFNGAEGPEKDALIAVWNGMVANAKALGGLGRTIAMCDFSGSMQSAGAAKDTPYWVSMAMGLLISEVTSDDFKNTFLSFDSNPAWHKLPSGDIFERAASIGHIGQGLSTDFQKAMDLVLGTLKEKHVPSGNEPKDLIVITDMAWDRACSSSETSYRHVVKTTPWQTHIEIIRESFRRAGEDMWGAGYGWKPPRIVIWNVAATCNDFHAMSDTDGVIMLSGWSPSLFKVLTEEGARIQTPAEAVRIQLDDPRYYAIRERLAQMRAPIRVP